MFRSDRTGLALLCAAGALTFVACGQSSSKSSAEGDGGSSEPVAPDSGEGFGGDPEGEGEGDGGAPPSPLADGGDAGGAKDGSGVDCTPGLGEAPRGGSVTFTATVTAGAGGTFEWFDNRGTRVAGESGPSLTLTSVDPSQSGAWRVVRKQGGEVFEGRCMLAVTEAQTSKAFVPLGVYWPGENTYGNDWARTQRELDDMRANGINAIWLTHKDAAYTAKLAVEAGKRGIYLVASLNDFSGEASVWNSRTNAQHKVVIDNALKAWGNAPAPIAWGLGDEADPREANYRRWVDLWATDYANQPVTAVHKPTQIAALAENLRYSRAFTADTYPFRPSRFSFPGGSKAALTRVPRQLARSSGTTAPWMMVAAYQERYDGPGSFSPEGDFVFGDGGAPAHLTVTAGQARWEAWKALANGARGVFFFAYQFTTNLESREAPSSEGLFRYANGLNTGAPGGMVYHKGTKVGRPGPAYIGASQAFKKLRVVGSILGNTQLVLGAEAWLGQSGAADGADVAVFRDPKTEARYVLVLAGQSANETTPRTVRFVVGPHVLKLRSLFTAQDLALTPDGQGVSAGSVSLVPGDADFFVAEIDKTNLPISYDDDFSTPKFAADSIASANVARTTNYYGRGLSPKGTEPAQGNFVDYDLDALLAPLPAGGVRALRYDGVSSAPDRGAFWWKRSALPFTGVNVANAFSGNAFNGNVAPFSERYLRLGVSVNGSDGKYVDYGYLKSFSVTQWPKKRP